MKNHLALLTILVVFSACLNTKDNTAKNQVKQEVSERKVFSAVERNYDIKTVVDNLSNPWGMTWLPDGSMLITEKKGDLI